MTNNVINLAHSIPVAETIHGVGELVFPRLRAWLHEIGADNLIPLIDAREKFGIAKHGQPLMTGDGRHTGTEIANEAADELAYGMKAWMQCPDLEYVIMDAMYASVEAAQFWMRVIELMEQDPVTQAELDRAGDKVREYRDLLGVKLILPDCVVTKIDEDETKC
jgi:hypothetical protein